MSATDTQPLDGDVLGHRWLAAACDAAAAAVEVASDEACEDLYQALLPHRGERVVLAAAFVGCVDQYLGALALRLGRVDDAIDQLQQAVADLDAMAALPHAARARAVLASALRARGDDAGATRAQADALDAAETLGMTRLAQSLTINEADEPSTSPNGHE